MDTHKALLAVYGKERPKGRLLERLWLLLSAFYTLPTEDLSDKQSRISFRSEASDKKVGDATMLDDSNLPNYSLRFHNQRGTTYLMFDVANDGRISKWWYDIDNDIDSGHKPVVGIRKVDANRVIESAILKTYRVNARYEVASIPKRTTDNPIVCEK